MGQAVKWEPLVFTRADGVQVGRGRFLDRDGHEIHKDAVEPELRGVLVNLWRMENGKPVETSGTVITKAEGVGGTVPPREAPKFDPVVQRWRPLGVDKEEEKTERWRPSYSTTPY